MKVLYANVRGLKSKMTCLKNILCEIRPNIVLLFETLLWDNKGVKIDGYTFFGMARKKGEGGGVGICVKNEQKKFIAPHLTQRPIEILWVSVARPHEKPLFIGVYYGLQESCNREKIQKEMVYLSEEIAEIKKEGEILLCMDANAKIGLMQEAKSRNGKLIEGVFQEQDIFVMNKTDKCRGLTLIHTGGGPIRPPPSIYC